MVNFSKKCAEEECSKSPSYGVAGSKKAEFCSQHARAGMVNVKSNACVQEDCSKQPSYGVAGISRREFCVQHARVGMVDVFSKKCGNEECCKRPSYGVAGTRRQEFCVQHARVGMINVMNRNYGKKDGFKQGRNNAHGFDRGRFQQPVELVANVSDAAELARERNTSSSSLTEGAGGGVVDGRGRKRNLPDGACSGSSDSIGYGHNVRISAWRGCAMPPLVSG